MTEAERYLANVRAKRAADRAAILADMEAKIKAMKIRLQQT